MLHATRPCTYPSVTSFRSQSGPRTDADLSIVASHYPGVHALSLDDLIAVTPDSIRMLAACRHLCALTLPLQRFYPKGAVEEAGCHVRSPGR